MVLRHPRDDLKNKKKNLLIEARANPYQRSSFWFVKEVDLEGRFLSSRNGFWGKLLKGEVISLTRALFYLY